MTSRIAQAPFLPLGGPPPLTVFRRILAPTDFKQAASLALDTAISLAQPLGAEVVLLHVMPLPGRGALLGEEDFEQQRSNTQMTLDAAVAAARVRYANLGFCLAEGPAAAQILATAASLSADLIVMGTHGRSGLERVFLGSVAEQVLRQSPTPVLTVSFRAQGTG